MRHIGRKGLTALSFLLAVFMITGCYDKVSFTKDKVPSEFSKGPDDGDLMDGKSPVGIIVEEAEGQSIHILSSDDSFNYDDLFSDSLSTDTSYLWLKMQVENTVSEEGDASSDEDAETRDRNGDNRLPTVIEGVLDGTPCFGAAKSNYFYGGKDGEKISGGFFGWVVCDDESDGEIIDTISGRYTVSLVDFQGPLPEINDTYSMEDIIAKLSKAESDKFINNMIAQLQEKLDELGDDEEWQKLFLENTIERLQERLEGSDTSE